MYNKSEIMKAAWSLKKSWHTKHYSFGECLKIAWERAKKAVAMAAANAVAYATKKFVDGMELTVDGYTRVLNRWTKNGHDRVYINGDKYTAYVDLKTGYVRSQDLAYQAKMAEIILAMEF